MLKDEYCNSSSLWVVLLRDNVIAKGIFLKPKSDHGISRLESLHCLHSWDKAKSVFLCAQGLA